MHGGLFLSWYYMPPFPASSEFSATSIWPGLPGSGASTWPLIATLTGKPADAPSLLATQKRLLSGFVESLR